MDQPTSEEQQQHPVDSVTPSDLSSGQVVPEEQAQAVVETSADVLPPPLPQAGVENGEKEKAVPESTETELKGANFSSQAISTEPKTELFSPGFNGAEQFSMFLANMPMSGEADMLLNEFRGLSTVEQKSIVFNLQTSMLTLDPASLADIQESALDISKNDRLIAYAEKLKLYSEHAEDFSPLWLCMAEMVGLLQDMSINVQSNDFSDIDLSSYSSADELSALGLENLEGELSKRGLKCGGSLPERADRLWAVRNLTPGDYPAQLLAKKK